MTKIKYIAYCLAALGLVSIAHRRVRIYRPEIGGKAKVTIDEARSIALKARPGTITDEELEKERGGSGLRYSFDIKSGRRLRDRCRCADRQGPRKL